MDETRRISAAEANRKFSELIRAVRDGQSVVVTSYGKPVMHCMPASEDDREQSRRQARAAHRKRVLARPVQNIPKTWTREDLYER
jgi:prevent-host-death family protein